MINKGWLKDETMTAFFKMVLRWLDGIFYLPCLSASYVTIQKIKI